MVADLQLCSYASDEQQKGSFCHIGEYVSAVNLKVRLTPQQPRSSVGSSTFSEGTSRCKFAAGKALTTASAAKPERTAKREKRIVIKLRGGKLGVSSSAWWTQAVDRYTFIPFGGVVNAQYRLTEKA